MATDVNGVSGAVGQPGRLATAKEGATSSTATHSARGAQDASNDTVELYVVSQAQKLADSVHAIPVVDGRRVQAVRNAIASGDYQVDPTQVADKLVAFESQVDTCRG